MDQESIVYGCIKDVGRHQDETWRRKINREAMLELPKSDEWPYLSQEMFAIPKLEISADLYLTEVMHFGASYKAIEYEWSQWLEKFESLLEKMCWVSAIVHLETELTGVHTFTWETQTNGHTPGSGMNQTHRQWVQENTFL